MTYMATKKINDGWHKICGYDCWVEDGAVMRGTLRRSGSEVTAYPYRKSRTGGWDSCQGISVAAFRAGVARGTVKMF